MWVIFHLCKNGCVHEPANNIPDNLTTGFTGWYALTHWMKAFFPTTSGFSCSNVALSTLQLPGCEEAVMVMAARTVMASESLEHSFESSFFVGGRGGQEEGAGAASILQWPSLCLLFFPFTLRCFTSQSEVRKTEPMSGNSVKGFQTVSYLLRG